MMTQNVRIVVASENAFIIYFDTEVNPHTARLIQQSCQLLEQALGDKLLDLIPSYTSLLVIYDLWRCDHLWVKAIIREQLAQLVVPDVMDNAPREVVELPVWYSVEAGQDLIKVATQAQLSINEVIALHQRTLYQVYTIGFAPGFAYLGQVDERIATPRLATPRLKVPRGSVAIADRQTAVYPAVSPGGWNLIGLCPVRMFDPHAEPIMPVRVGDKVRFYAIDRAEFLAMGGELP